MHCKPVYFCELFFSFSAVNGMKNIKVGSLKFTGIQCRLLSGNIVLNEVLFIAESLWTGKGFLRTFAYFTAKTG